MWCFSRRRRRGYWFVYVITSDFTAIKINMVQRLTKLTAGKINWSQKFPLISELQGKDRYLRSSRHHVCSVLHNRSVFLPGSKANHQIPTRDKKCSAISDISYRVKSRFETQHTGYRVRRKTFCSKHWMLLSSAVELWEFFWAQQDNKESLSESLSSRCA